MIRRLIAYFIDWYLVLIVMNTVLIAAAYVLSGTVYVGSLPLTYFDADVQLPLLLVLVCIEVLFYCVIPRFAWRGQTIGKKLLRLRVTRADGEPAGLSRLLLRDLVAVTLIEGCFSPLSNYVRNYLMLFFERDIIQYTVWFSWGGGRDFGARAPVYEATDAARLHCRDGGFGSGGRHGAASSRERMPECAFRNGAFFRRARG